MGNSGAGSGVNVQPWSWYDLLDPVVLGNYFPGADFSAGVGPEMDRLAADMATEASALHEPILSGESSWSVEQQMLPPSAEVWAPSCRFGNVDVHGLIMPAMDVTSTEWGFLEF